MIIYCIGFVIAFVAGFFFGFSFASAALGGGSPAVVEQELISAFNDLIITILVSGAVMAIAYVIFTYALQDSAGRLLLYIAFATQLAVAVLIASIVSPQVAGAVSQSFSNGTFDLSPLRDLQAQLQVLQLIGLIPAAIFATAYYKAYSRITNGKVPPSATPVAPVLPNSGSA